MLKAIKRFAACSRARRVLCVLAVLSVFTSATAVADDSPGRSGPVIAGDTVYDAASSVTWLADGDLAASDRFGLRLCTTGSNADKCVNKSGTMTFQAATAWVLAMNASRYAGVSDWQLPTTPVAQPQTKIECPRTGPHGNTFGFNCADNALGSLYYDTLGLSAPNTAVAIPANMAGPFSNVQPYLYWSRSPGSGGRASFSFTSGYQGANTIYNFLYVLPMIHGRIAGTPGTYYDAATNTTWLTDADIAATNTFGLKTCAAPLKPRLCVDSDGAMTWNAAREFVANMNSYDGTGYLDQKHWALPPSSPSCRGYGCATDNPLGDLFYNVLDLPAGATAVTAPDVATGAFHDLRPYLYWSCGANAIRQPCEYDAATNFEWSFSFGDGFLGTDLDTNDLYVTAYYYPTPSPVKPGKPGCTGTDCT
jgi:hypothetical protein